MENEQGHLGLIKKESGKISFNEQDYRKHYLKADIDQSKKAMLLFLIPIACFAYNDYIFFGLNNVFWALITIRAILLTIISLEIVFIGRIKNDPQRYDSTIFWATLLIIFGAGIINATRPDNYVIHSMITTVSILALYLVIPLRFLYQTILAAILTIGEMLIILIFNSNALITESFTAFWSMIIAFAIAGYFSLRIHLFRRQSYENHLQEKANQESLAQHANNLSDLVEDQTKELADTQSRLIKSERLAAIGELAGMVAHDLRNPLSSIKNANYLLRKKYSDETNKEVKDMLTIIDRGVETANNIAADLLDYSREMKLDFEEYSPKSLVNYVLLSFKPINNVRIVDGTESFPTFQVDAGKIERVLTNLIKNAAEAMPNGGTVKIGSRQNGSNIEFTFQDTGAGMSPEVMSKLFTPLYTTKTAGTGLGLAICKRIVEAHKGKINVKSIPNQGTTFTVSLPIEQNQQTKKQSRQDNKI